MPAPQVQDRLRRSRSDRPRSRSGGRQIARFDTCLQIGAKFLPQPIGLGLHDRQAKSAQPAQQVHADLDAQLGAAIRRGHEKDLAALLERAGHRGILARPLCAQILRRTLLGDARAQLELGADEGNLLVHDRHVLGGADDLDRLHAGHGAGHHLRIQQQGPHLRRRCRHGQPLFNFHVSSPRPRAAPTPRSACSRCSGTDCRSAHAAPRRWKAVACA